MTRKDKLLAKKNRLNTIEGRGNKNIKCPGVVKKLKREIRNLESAADYLIIQSSDSFEAKTWEISNEKE